MCSPIRFYRRRMPHFRTSNGIYFVTWRRRPDQGDVSEMERREVTAALRWFDGVRYRLHAYVVMNDHVHVLVEPLNDWSLQKIMHSWKSFTANRFQRLYGRPGAVWQHESFDRVIRDDAEYDQKRDYILANPFKRWPHLDSYRWVWAIGWDDPA
jgi:REP element-mobilizing transposase RayT